MSGVVVIGYSSAVSACTRRSNNSRWWVVAPPDSLGNGLVVIFNTAAERGVGTELRIKEDILRNGVFYVQFILGFLFYKCRPGEGGTNLCASSVYILVQIYVTIILLVHVRFRRVNGNSSSSSIQDCTLHTNLSKYFIQTIQRQNLERGLHPTHRHPSMRHANATRTKHGAISTPISVVVNANIRLYTNCALTCACLITMCVIAVKKK